MKAFDAALCLRKATSRAKSDVANKLISMFLHDLSRRICTSLGLAVTDAKYANAVANEFGHACCYCRRPLETDRAAVEHLEGMNRFRVGLHIPGNVIVSCKRCNGEKRRDDQLHTLILAETGWESFLAHGGTGCVNNCKSCNYWSEIWIEPDARIANMRATVQKLRSFRSRYPEFLEAATEAKIVLPRILDRIYRECQEFAFNKIKSEVDGVSDELMKRLKP